MWWPFRKRKDQDLSALYEGELEITIEGLGTQRAVFDFDTLAAHVACVYFALAPDCPGLLFIDPRRSPWEVVSFQPEARRLIVKPV